METFCFFILIAIFGCGKGYLIATNYTDKLMVKPHRKIGRSFIGVGATTAAPAAASDLIITGIADREKTGGDIIELYVLRDITDMSEYAFGIARNGGGTGGIGFTFPSDSYTAGDFIYIHLQGDEGMDTDLAFFGVTADYDVDCCGGVSGNDAIELFHLGVEVDVVGEISINGAGTAYDYDEGWAYRVNGARQTTTFDINDWTFSGVQVLTDQPSNAASSPPMPLGTYSP